MPHVDLIKIYSYFKTTVSGIKLIVTFDFLIPYIFHIKPQFKQKLYRVNFFTNFGEIYDYISLNTVLNS
jgi:hypothetical protein